MACHSKVCRHERTSPHGPPHGTLMAWHCDSRQQWQLAEPRPTSNHYNNRQPMNPKPMFCRTNVGRLTTVYCQTVDSGPSELPQLLGSANSYGVLSISTMQWIPRHLGMLRATDRAATLNARVAGCGRVPVRGNAWQSGKAPYQK